MTRFLRVGTLAEGNLHELGEAVLRMAFRDAAKVFLALTQGYDQAELSQLQQSVAFIQGSGLELFITRYHLVYDPTSLRETFQWKLHQLASSSPTTLGGRYSNGA